MLYNLEYAVEVDKLWKLFTEDKNFRFEENQVSRYIADGAVAAVCDVSLRIKRGEVFVVMGLSGSGKSTLIRCLTRLIEPSSGKIKINGNDVSQMDEKELTEFRRTQVAMVFQHYGLLPHRTVLENVAFGLKLRGIDAPTRAAQAREVIEKVGLEGWEEHYPAQLSGGMQQRVGIARALVQDTNLLLMDEPFSGLDPLIKREMQDELIRLQNELRKTIVFVTHDISEAVRLGDRMLVMKDGKSVQEGKPQEIIMNPVDDYVQKFVQDEQQIALRLEKVGRKSKLRGLDTQTGDMLGHSKVKAGRA